MESFIMVKFKAVSGDTTVYLDSAKNFKEAVEQMSLLDKSEAWCLKINKVKKEVKK